MPCRRQEAQPSTHTLLVCYHPRYPQTHVVPAPPQLAELGLGPAQLGLKVQDLVLGCSLLGGCVLLGLFHLPRKHRGGAGLPDTGTPGKEEAGPLPLTGLTVENSLQPQGGS